MWQNLFSRKFLAKCEHKTYKKDLVSAFGEKCITKVPVNNKTTPYCHRCLEKMAIRCAWCGEVIFIGDPITLYTPDENFKAPEYSVVYKNDPLQLVGCLRWDCAESGADRIGFWLPPGKVEKIMSPIEQCFRSGQSVVVMDLSKM